MNRRASARSARSAVRAGEDGAVLVVVMLVLVSLMGLGMTAMWVTNSTLQAGASINLRSNALLVAEAGIERARAILNDPVAPNVPLMLAGNTPGSDDVPTSVDATTGDPDGVGAILVDNAGLPLLNVPYPPISFGRGASEVAIPNVVGTYTVWIRNDTAEIRQGFFTADSNNTVVVRSQGTAADGRTTVVLEVTMGPTPANVPGGGGNNITPPELCNSGKNACDDNNSTLSGIVVN